MIKGCVVLLATSAGGAAGWRMGTHIGFMTAYFLSVVGSATGFYLARQFGRNYLD